jgi:sn-glycerol 3-phosphate transport system substrate-binding protein
MNNVKGEEKPMRSLNQFKSLVTTLFCVIICLSFSTCIASNTNQNEIVLWHSLDGPLGEKFDILVNRFNEQPESKKANYKVVTKYKGTYEQTFAAGQKVLNTPSSPHILQIYEMGNAAMQANPNSFVALDKLMAKPSSVLKREHFIPFIYNFYKSRDGDFLASLPFSASSVIINAGLDPEKPPVTWEEFEQMAAILKEKGAKYVLASGWLSGHHLDHTGAWHNEPIASKGNGIESDQAEIIVNRPFFRHHLSKLASWYQVGLFSLESGTQSEQAFAEGDVIILTQGSNRLPGIEKNVNGRFQIGVGKLPYWKSQVAAPQNTIAGGASFWALAGHKQEEYAVIQKFFEYLASAQIQSEWHQETGYMPVVVGATEIAQKQGFYEKSIKGKAAKIALDSFSENSPKEHSRGIRLPNFPKVREVMVHEMKEAIKGNKTPAASLEEIEKAGNKIMQEKSI